MDTNQDIIYKNYLIAECMIRCSARGVYKPQICAFRLAIDNGKCYIELADGNVESRRWGKMSFIGDDGKTHKYVFEDYEEYKSLISRHCTLLIGNVLWDNNESALMLKLRSKLFDIIKSNATHALVFKRHRYFENDSIYAVINKINLELPDMRLLERAKMDMTPVLEAA